MNRINVTKTFLPPIEEYEEYLKRIWSSGHITNQGPLLKEFEEEVSKRFGFKYFQLTTNGTVALQVALKALEIGDGEVITTPFSYVATTSSILWERSQPVFVDIDTKTFCLDADKLEQAITSKTKAILAVHVFGNICDVEKIEKIAKKSNLKVIYDAAHAFGVEYKGESILSYGDISVCSFHATKLFHTIEGGGIVTSNKALDEAVDLIKRFGHTGDEHYRLGINAKASEFQAAMGLANLKYFDAIIEYRKKIVNLYSKLLGGKYYSPATLEGATSNYAYFPIVLQSESQLVGVVGELNKNSIFPRRYFYPALNTLPYLAASQKCPIAEDISSKIISLPLYYGLDEEIVRKICEIILK